MSPLARYVDGWLLLQRSGMQAISQSPPPQIAAAAIAAAAALTSLPLPPHLPSTF